MKVELKKKLPITIAIMAISILTVVFAVISMNNRNIYLFHILTQVSLFLTMLLSGVNSFVYQKQRMLGVFMWLVSAFVLVEIVDTIITLVGI